MRPITGYGNARSAASSRASARPLPRLPPPAGTIANPKLGSCSTGDAPLPIWLIMGAARTV